MPDSELTERYAAALARRATEGRIPSTREPLPFRSMAEVMTEVAADTTQDLVSEARGMQALITVLVDRLGGDVTITHDDLGHLERHVTSHVDATSVRLVIS